MQARGTRRGYSLAELLIGMTLCALLMTTILAFCVTGVRIWKQAASKVDINEGAIVAIHAFRGWCGSSHILSAYLNPAGVAAGISFLSADRNGTLAFHVSQPNPCCFIFKPCGACIPACVGGCGGIPPCLPYQRDGYPVWQKFVILYWDPPSRTIRLGMQALYPPAAQPSVCGLPGVNLGICAQNTCPAWPNSGQMVPQPYQLKAYTPNLAKDQVVASNIDFLKVSVDEYDQPINPGSGICHANCASCKACAACCVADVCNGNGCGKCVTVHGRAYPKCYACPCPPRLAVKPCAQIPGCPPVPNPCAINGWPVNDVCPCTKTAPAHMPVQNPIFVTVIADKIENSTGGLSGQSATTTVGDLQNANLYKTVLTTAINFQNGFNLGVNAGECATGCLGSCCQCWEP